MQPAKRSFEGCVVGVGVGGPILAAVAAVDVEDDLSVVNCSQGASERRGTEREPSSSCAASCGVFCSGAEGSVLVSSAVENEVEGVLDAAEAEVEDEEEEISFR